MEGIEVIETEWGSPLHRELIALEEQARVEWRNSPEAIEEMHELALASKKPMGPLEIAPRPEMPLNLPVHVWE